MRTLIASAFVSLDGVVEAPGGEAGYRSSGWTFKDIEFDPAAYRIVLEAVKNARLHSGARTCRVTIAGEEMLTVRIRDDFSDMSEKVSRPRGPTGPGGGGWSRRNSLRLRRVRRYACHGAFSLLRPEDEEHPEHGHEGCEAEVRVVYGPKPPRAARRQHVTPERVRNKQSG